MSQVLEEPDTPLRQVNIAINRTDYLFGNTVFNSFGWVRAMEVHPFSRRPWQSIGLSDDDYVPLLYDVTLYLPDPITTLAYEARQADQASLRREVVIMKGVLVDENMPASAWESDDTIDFLTRTGITMYGRLGMATLVGDLKVYEAFPELREAMMHDSDEEVREESTKSMAKLGGRRAAYVLREKLADKNETMRIREAAAECLFDIPYLENVPVLRDVYYETEYTRPKDVHPRAFNQQWLPCYCLTALGRISSLEALGVIEDGINGPFMEIEWAARWALELWKNGRRKLISSLRWEHERDDEETRLMHLLIKHGEYNKWKAYMEDGSVKPSVTGEGARGGGIRLNI